MPVVRGKLRLRVGIPFYHGLHDRIREFIEARMGGYNRLPIQFYFRDMDMQSDSAYSYHDDSYIHWVDIPFNAHIENFGWRSGDIDYDVRSLLSREFQEIIPDAFEGIIGLRIDHDYDYFSEPPDYESAACHYNHDYNGDMYSYGEDNFHGCRMNTDRTITNPKDEPVIEKTSTTRKVFILQDEGD